jgi:enterochelin esterase-like enzyme
MTERARPSNTLMRARLSRAHLRWVLGAALLASACQAGTSAQNEERLAAPAAAVSVVAPATSVPPPAAPAAEPPATLRPMARQEPAGAGGSPVAAEALPEWVGPLWGRFREGRFYSAALDREMPYYIYLPPGLERSDRRVPVLYMLHGAAGDNAEWATIKLIDWADRLIVGQEIPPLIVVLPQGDFGYWVNHVDGGPRWGDYLVADFVGHLDASYPTLPQPRGRAVGGLSQGGHAAFQLTFNHPEVFGVAGAHSPSLRPDDGFLPWLGTGAEFQRRDPISLVQALPLATLLRPKLWLDVGADDQWRPRVELLHEALVARGVPHEWHVWPGGHDGEYWQPNVPTYLRFYGRALREGPGG